jgi:hypothetical protein
MSDATIHGRPNPTAMRGMRPNQPSRAYDHVRQPAEIKVSDIAAANCGNLSNAGGLAALSICNRWYETDVDTRN